MGEAFIALPTPLSRLLHNRAGLVELKSMPRPYAKAAVGNRNDHSKCVELEHAYNTMPFIRKYGDLSDRCEKRDLYSKSEVKIWSARAPNCWD